MTGTGDREHDLGRVPCTNTGDLAETLVGLARQLLRTPTVSDTLETMTLRHRNNIHNLVLLEDSADLHRLFEKAVGELDLVCDRTTVDLNLHEVCLLLAKTGLAYLSVGKNTNNSAVFADTLEFTGSRLATIFCVLLGIPSECLLL